MRTQVGQRRTMSSSSPCVLVLLMSMMLLCSISSVQACNICGCEGCAMANTRTIITFYHNNNKKQMSCGDLQDKANGGGFDEDFCKTEIVTKAWEKCNCYNKFGQLLTDYYAQTIPPAIDPPVNENQPPATEDSEPPLTDATYQPETQQPSRSESLTRNKTTVDEDDLSLDNVEDDMSVNGTKTPLDIESSNRNSTMAPSEPDDSLPDGDDGGKDNSIPTMWPSSLPPASTTETATVSPSEPVLSGTPPVVQSTTAPSEAIVVDSAPTPAPDLDAADSSGDSGQPAFSELKIAKTFQGISMVLEGITIEFDDNTKEAWIEITKIFFENVHRGIIQEEDQQRRGRRRLQTNGIRAFETDIRFERQTVSKHDKSSSIRYSQSVHYIQTSETAPSTLQLIEGPFVNQALNRQYVELLKELSGGSGHDLFSSLQTETIAVPTIPDQASVESDNEKKSGNPLEDLSMGFIAGIAVAGALAIGLIYFVCRQRSRSNQRNQRDKSFRLRSAAAPHSTADSWSYEFDSDDEMGGRNPYLDDHIDFEDPMDDEQLEQSIRRSYRDEDDDECSRISRDNSQASGLSRGSSHGSGLSRGSSHASGRGSKASDHSRKTPSRTHSEVQKSLQHAYMDDLREHAKRPSVVGKSRKPHENTAIYRPEQPAERTKDKSSTTTTRMNTITMEDLFPEQKPSKNQHEEQTTKRRSSEDDITKPPTTTTTTTTAAPPTFSRLEDFFPDEDGMNLEDLYLREDVDDVVFQDDPTVASHGTNYSYNRAFGQHNGDDKSVVSVQSGGGMVFVEDDMYEDVNVYQHDQQQQQVRQQRNNNNHQQHRHLQQQYDPEIVVIEAPPGWLGVVIDTPEVMGPPVVYEIMESSPIAGQIRLGDQLLSVDDIDVQDMTATQVSRIISQKANNPVRTFCVIRIPDGRKENNSRNLIV